MELYQASFFCTKRDPNTDKYTPISLGCQSNLGTTTNDIWPITLLIGKKENPRELCFHLASLDQLLELQESFNAAVAKAVAELRPATDIVAKMIALPSQLVVTKASEMEKEMSA